MPVMLGRYELLGPIGRGGMAEVHLARRRGPGGVEKQLVVKRIRREKTRDPRFVQMFIDEARLSMALSHKNIVPVFDFGRAGDELFLVMEYVDGADLGVALAGASAPLPPALVAFVGLEACQALDYAHARGVVHRDVTPTNVLVSRAGEVKLADFGVATAETDCGARGTVRGTPLYMSPEQARGAELGPPSDVFSLGLVLWEAVSGRRAYAGDDASARLAVARRGEVPALSADVPAALRRAIERATRADVEARFDSARSLQLALDDYLVAARAEAAGAPPPAHALATWLEAAIRGRDGVAEVAIAPPAGEVVTFLEDGALLSTLAESRGGTGTQRSLAVTMADGETAGADPGGAREGGGTRGRHAPAGAWRPRRAAVGLALVLAGAAAAAVAVSRGGSGGAVTSGVASADAGAQLAAEPGGLAALAHADAGTQSADARPAEAEPARAAAAARAVPADPASAGASGAPSRPNREPGTLRVGAEPGWAKVRVVGTDRGCEQTPCSLTLPAGRYRLALDNPFSGHVGEREVEVAPGEETRVVIRLGPARR